MINYILASTEAIGGTFYKRTPYFFEEPIFWIIITTLTFMLLFITKAYKASKLKKQLKEKTIELEKAKEHIKCIEEKNK